MSSSSTSKASAANQCGREDSLHCRTGIDHGANGAAAATAADISGRLDNVSEEHLVEAATTKSGRPCGVESRGPHDVERVVVVEESRTPGTHGGDATAVLVSPGWGCTPAHASATRPAPAPTGRRDFSSRSGHRAQRSHRFWLPGCGDKPRWRHRNRGNGPRRCRAGRHAGPDRHEHLRSGHDGRHPALSPPTVSVGARPTWTRRPRGMPRRWVVVTYTARGFWAPVADPPRRPCPREVADARTLVDTSLHGTTSDRTPPAIRGWRWPAGPMAGARAHARCHRPRIDGIVAWITWNDLALSLSPVGLPGRGRPTHHTGAN